MHIVKLEVVLVLLGWLTHEGLAYTRFCEEVDLVSVIMFVNLIYIVGSLPDNSKIRWFLT